MENYCWNDDLMNLARVVYSITILLTFPIECLVSRAVVEGLWGPLDTPQSHRLATLALVTAAYLVSVSTDCLGVVLELNVSNWPKYENIGLIGSNKVISFCITKFHAIQYFHNSQLSIYFLNILD